MSHKWELMRGIKNITVSWAVFNLQALQPVKQHFGSSVHSSKRWLARAQFIHSRTLISLPVWPSKISRRPTPTFLLLVYVYRAEPQREDNGTMIHQQQERQEAKHHVKVRWDVIQFCLDGRMITKTNPLETADGDMQGFRTNSCKRRKCLNKWVILQHVMSHICTGYKRWIKSDWPLQCAEGQGFCKKAIIRVQQSKTWHRSPSIFSKSLDWFHNLLHYWN